MERDNEMINLDSLNEIAKIVHEEFKANFMTDTDEKENAKNIAIEALKRYMGNYQSGSIID